NSSSSWSVANPSFSAASMRQRPRRAEVRRAGSSSIRMSHDMISRSDDIKLLGSVKWDYHLHTCDASLLTGRGTNRTPRGSETPHLFVITSGRLSAPHDSKSQRRGSTRDV